MTIINERYKQPIIIKSSVNLLETVVLTYILKNVNYSNDSKVSKRDVNLLVANMYCMVAFKIHVFDASLFEETPSRSSSEIWESFLSWMFSPIL